MALDPATWLAVAQALPVGGSRRAKHDCGPGLTLIVNHEDEGWSAYCFRCAEPGWVPRPRESLQERLTRLTRVRQADRELEAQVVPPMPAEFDVGAWPVRARAWLYRAGLSNLDIKKHGVYYHAPSDRVVLPVMKDGALVYWQARGFNPDLAKYINPKVDRDHLVAEYGSGPLLVLTEDILSCWRVGAVSEAWSLLGTKLPVPILNRIAVMKDREVAVWLDPDKAGDEGAATVLHTLRLYGIKARKVASTRDPKLHSHKEIECLLSDHCCK